MEGDTGSVTTSKAILRDYDLCVNPRFGHRVKRKESVSTVEESGDDDVAQKMKTMGLPTSFKTTKKPARRKARFNSCSDEDIEQFLDHEYETHVAQDGKSDPETEFQELWLKIGHDVVNECWKITYGHLMDDDCLKDEVIQSKANLGDQQSTLVDQTVIVSDQETIPSDHNVHQSSWALIWQRFNDDLYAKAYNVFMNGGNVYDQLVNSSKESQSKPDDELGNEEPEILPIARCGISQDEEQDLEEDGFVLDLKSVKKRIRKKKKKQKKKKLKTNKHEEAELEYETCELDKYWCQRYRLFSRFDEGIELDDESWYSVTPERIAEHIAARVALDGKINIIIDGFCGAGGNTIQFAIKCDLVIAIDIDPKKIQLAQNNCRVYHIDHKVEFILGDYFQVIQNLKSIINRFGDEHVQVSVFLSPPWGGPDYLSKETYSLSDMNPDGFKIILATQEHLTRDLAILLPRNVDKSQLMTMAGQGQKVELENNILNGKIKTITAYFGNLIIT